MNVEFTSELKLRLESEGYTFTANYIMKEGMYFFYLRTRLGVTFIEPMYDTWKHLPAMYQPFFKGNLRGEKLSYAYKVVMMELGLLEQDGQLFYKGRLTPFGLRHFLAGTEGFSEAATKKWVYKHLRKQSTYLVPLGEPSLLSERRLYPKDYAYDVDLEGVRQWVTSLEGYFSYHGRYYHNSTLRYHMGHENNIPLPYLIEHFEWCEEHDRYYHSSDGCPACMVQFAVHSYRTRAEDTLPFKDEGEKAPVHLGIELEYENCVGKARQVYESLPNHVILKRDGSIRNGFEIVTCPGTLASHKKAFKGFYDKVDGLQSLSNCGMHVHIDKKKLSHMQVGKMLYFLNNKANLPFIVKVAGRSPNNFCNVDDNIAITSGFSRDSFGEAHRRGNSKYSILNTGPTATVEVRIFAAPKDEKELFSRLEFVQALVDFTKAAVAGVRELTWDKFKSFVLSTPSVYPTLKGVL